MFSTLTQYRDTAQYRTIKGLKIAYWRDEPSEKAKDKPHLLLLHGFPSASYDWHLLWPSLAQHFRCHAFDFLGFGLSQKPYGHRYTLVEQADIAQEYLRLEGITQCWLLAHDYGVSVAQELLCRHDQYDFNIQQCAFLNGGLFADQHRPLLMQRLLKSILGPMIVPLLSKRSLHQSFTKIFGPHTPPSAQLIDVLWELLKVNGGTKVIPALLQYLDERAVYATKWREAMLLQQQKLAFINGVHDPISGTHMLEAFAVCCPEADTKSLNVGHYPQLEDANAVYSALKEIWRL